MSNFKFYHWLIIAFIGMVIIGLGIGYVVDRSKNKSVQGIETHTVTPKLETPKTEVKKDANVDKSANDATQNTPTTTGSIKKETTAPTSTESNNSTVDIPNQIIVPTPEPPSTSNDTTWTNSHGTFSYSKIGSVTPMYTGKDISITGIGWSKSSCQGFRVGDTLLIPANTEIVSKGSSGSWYDDTSSYAFNLTNYHNQSCSDRMPQYFFYFNFSDPWIYYAPDKMDLWW